MNDYTWTLTAQQRCDVELLLTHAYAPLHGFMIRRDYEEVLNHMSLATGDLWTIPIVLDVTQAFAEHLSLGDRVVLTRDDATPLAWLQVEDIYRVDLELEAEIVYGTQDPRHAGVHQLLRRHGTYVGGRVEVIDQDRLVIARHADFLPLYKTPDELVAQFQTLDQPVVAFHTRNAMHQGHYTITREAQRLTGGHLLLHPTIGPTKSDDWDPALRLKAIMMMAQHYPLTEGGAPSVTLATLPLAMRLAGPREAVWHALVRQNFGVDYFIVGRAPADPGKNPDRPDGLWYSPYAAHDLLQAVRSRMKIQPITLPEYAWHRAEERFVAVTPHNQEHVEHLSGSQMRSIVRSGHSLPKWFAPPSVRHVIQSAYRDKGAVVLLTGLPASGKTTLAKALTNQLLLHSRRPITLLDGDVIRQHLSQGLGFSQTDRLINMERVAFMAGHLARVGGLVLISMVAPLERGRQMIRNMVQADGDFLEVYLSTPLEECQRRDPKGLYRQAKAGRVVNMTGLSDPYEVPASPDLTIVSGAHPFWEDLQAMMDLLESRGLIEHQRAAEAVGQS